MINKWLRFGVVLWRVKNLSHHFLGELQMRLGIEHFIKRQQWSTILQAIAGQLEFSSCVDISNLELNTWTIGGLRHPQEEISVFMAIKE
mgnify:CR=1 FL=1